MISCVCTVKNLLAHKNYSTCKTEGADDAADDMEWEATIADSRALYGNIDDNETDGETTKAPLLVPTLRGSIFKIRELSTKGKTVSFVICKCKVPVFSIFKICQTVYL